MTEADVLKMIEEAPLKLDLFKNDYDPHDSFGSVMAHWFALCSVLHFAIMSRKTEVEIPRDWKYNPSPFLDGEIEPDLWPDYEYHSQFQAGQISAEDLLHDGNLFNEFYNAMLKAGMDY